MPMHEVAPSAVSIADIPPRFVLDRGQVPVRILNAGIAEMRAIVMFCKFFAVYLQDSK